MATFDFLGYFCNKKIFLSTEILVSNSSTLELKIKVIEKKETHFNGYQRVEKIILEKQTRKKLKKKEKKSLYMRQQRLWLTIRWKWDLWIEVFE